MSESSSQRYSLRSRAPGGDGICAHRDPRSGIAILLLVAGGVIALLGERLLGGRRPL